MYTYGYNMKLNEYKASYKRHGEVFLHYSQRQFFSVVECEMNCWYKWVFRDYFPCIMTKSQIINGTGPSNIYGTVAKYKRFRVFISKKKSKSILYHVIVIEEVIVMIKLNFNRVQMWSTVLTDLLLFYIKNAMVLKLLTRKLL